MVSLTFILIGIASLIACAIYKIYMPYIIIPFALICIGILFRQVKFKKGSKDNYTGVDDTLEAHSLFKKYFSGRSSQNHDSDYDSWD